jgi:exopolysaccharide biosynthesis WecB/TagA/CpsF family protein
MYVMYSKYNILTIIKPKITDDLGKVLSCNSLNSFLNPYSYMVARNKLDVFREMDNIFIDGGMLQFLMQFLLIKKVSRLSFDFGSIAGDVFNYCVENKKSIYFVGSKNEEINDFYNKIKKRYPNMEMLGFHSGYFSKSEKKIFSDNINSIKPNFIICGMGTPRQEEMLIYLKDNGWEGTGFTCGGFFHQTASSKGGDYYPVYVNKLNIRWLYRVIDEPKLAVRYFIQYPKSVAILLYDRFYKPYS